MKIVYITFLWGIFLFISAQGKAIPIMLESSDTSSASFLKGRIQDLHGNLLAGVSVSIKGTKMGTVTDNQGNFFFKKISSSAILVFSYVGYKSQMLNVPTTRMMLVILETAENQLDEAVVLAYGSTTKRFNTNNSGSVKASEIAAQPISNPLLALQGKVPGVVITPSNGVNNGGVRVTIQGNTSLSALVGNDPLYVIDGVPYTSQLMNSPQSLVLGSSGTVGTTTTYGNPMSFINPSDIERIDILKDADATAIYGSRAANGAILITTKKGKSGKMAIEFNANTGFSKLVKFANLLRTPDYITLRKEAFKNYGLTPSAIPGTPTYAVDLTRWDSLRYTNWQKELLGSYVPFSTLEASVSGGSDNLRYRISGTYRYMGSLFENAYGLDHDRKASMSASLNSNSSDNRFKVDLNVRYMFDGNKMSRTDYTASAYRLPPNAPALYNNDGSLNWEPDINGNSSWTNPLAQKYTGYFNNTTNLGSSLMLSYNFLNGLQFKTLFGYNNLQTDDYSFNTKQSFSPETRTILNTTAIKGSYNINNWDIEPQIQYSDRLGVGNFDAIVGMSIQQENRSGLAINGTIFSSDLSIFDIKQASSITINTNEISTYKYNALFAKLNYNLDDKYILNLSFRRDGSSRFGKANRFHDFGSIGGAWIISEEGWFKRIGNLVNFLKLRASYGTTGNDQIGNYSFYNLYNVVSAPISYQGITTIATSGIPNPYLQWEETRKLDIGIELAVLKSRLIASLGYIRNRSSNQIVAYDLPATTGASSINQNFPGLIQNSSFEGTISTINIRREEFSWSSNINLTIPRNKLVRFENIESSSYAAKYKIGEPITVVRIFRYAGVNPETGIYEFYAADGTKTSNPKTNIDDLTYVNFAPTMYGGFQNTFSYRNFQIDFFIQYTKQRNADLAIAGGGGVPGNMINVLESIMNRWQKKGDITNVQKVANSSQLNNSTIAAYTSDLVYHDASFVRLKNVNVSYKLPTNWLEKIHIHQARVYVQGQNLLTITPYKGLDPENPGTAVTLPPLMTIVAGISISL
ncbi:SusC/RagA family TonB-linked outer membrane protein [Chitinophaga sp. sic0106]|uniref:SusC/RagA family TonB-linked outer membrane protein n=1 Tax=Chitinophaga sp. sic0106 TaxID=2854785 RepID=UPI001C43D51A|nr:SusC/RagA family TonB-linked outer membrane protein [Chitinophaga sp. sic0106]MBV7531388.1 SusC/RagA family TonB-linked outer membrane protein [Chitinophaga sp. sic0106]